MSDTLLPSDTSVQKKGVQQTGLRIFSGRQGRKIRENLLAYALLLPAFLIIFTFGIFPLAFSAYQSTLGGLNKIVGTYVGLGNYIRAIDNLTYVIGFWLAAGFIFMGLQTLNNVRRSAAERQEKPWAWFLPSALLASGLLLFTRFFFLFLPELLGVADKMRTAQRAGEGPPSALFRQFVSEGFQLPHVQQAFWQAIGILLIAIILSIVFTRLIPYSRHQGDYFSNFMQTTVLLVSGTVLGWYVWSELQRAYAEAMEAGESLDIWTQIIIISAGLILLMLSWRLWSSASQRNSNASMIFRLGAAVMLMIGGYLLVAELPLAITAGDKKWWTGLQTTVYYSMGTIPFQMAISLMLATILFQDIRGKSFFRVIYFLPYITPVVGAAAIFRILFSGRVDAPINRIMTSLGLPALGWLNEPNGIFQLILGDAVALPTWAVGPSLSLVVVIIFGVWTFVGFNTVIFLAGLGSIPGSLYESAAIDGAGRWAQFRHITLPLLSPTIYLLTLYAVIGTFKAFSHIFVLRTGAALGSTDTASVVIFDAFNRDTRIGYASALAILLLLIVMGLTIFNNRIASKKVFYG